MKVLFLVHSSVISGAEKSLLSLVAGLIGKGYRCIVASPHPDLLRSAFADDSLDYVEVPFLGNLERDLNPICLVRMLFRVLVGAVGIAHLALREQVDVLHANSIACGIYGGLAGRLSGCRVVMHVRDMPQSALTKRLVRWLVVHWIHKTIFVSQAVARHYFPWAMENDKWTVIYNGIDQAVFAVTAAMEEKQLQRRGVVMPRGQAIGIVGLLTPWKGYHIAINAFAEVVKSHPKANLWIVGSGNDQEYQRCLEEQVRELGLEGKVFFTGYVREVGAIIKNLCVLINASINPDPLPRVLLEGMALGVPIVAPAIGGIPEQIEDGINGYLFKPGNAAALAECICKLLNNPERSAAMGQSGVAIVKEKFSLVRQVEQVERLYASLLDSGENG